MKAIVTLERFYNRLEDIKIVQVNDMHLLKDALKAYNVTSLYTISERVAELDEILHSFQGDVDSYLVDEIHPETISTQTVYIKGKKYERNVYKIKPLEADIAFIVARGLEEEVFLGIEPEVEYKMYPLGNIYIPLPGTKEVYIPHSLKRIPLLQDAPKVEGYSELLNTLKLQITETEIPTVFNICIDNSSEITLETVESLVVSILSIFSKARLNLIVPSMLQLPEDVATYLISNNCIFVLECRSLQDSLINMLCTLQGKPLIHVSYIMDSTNIQNALEDIISLRFQELQSSTHVDTVQIDALERDQISDFFNHYQDLVEVLHSKSMSINRLDVEESQALVANSCILCNDSFIPIVRQSNLFELQGIQDMLAAIAFKYQVDKASNLFQIAQRLKVPFVAYYGDLFTEDNLAKSSQWFFAKTIL